MYALITSFIICLSFTNIAAPIFQYDSSGSSMKNMLTNDNIITKELPYAIHPDKIAQLKNQFPALSITPYPTHKLTVSGEKKSINSLKTLVYCLLLYMQYR